MADDKKTSNPGDEKDSTQSAAAVPSGKRQDKEVQQYRTLLEPPDHFEDGFGIKMLVAALFLGFLMVPASLYLSLFIGQSMGPAAQWVTIILFSEVTKRSMKSLKKQEVYLLFYMTGIALGGSHHIQGGILSQLLWNQYFVQSQAAIGLGVASQVPTWVAPGKEVIEATGRTFFNSFWMQPIAFIVGTMILGRIDKFGLGYALYRLTAHVEKLPFPMAPVGALGITALAEQEDRSNRWRWQAFSLGGALGLGFGGLYIGLPAISGALFGQTVQMIPIPWLDLTHIVSTRDFAPAVPVNIIFDFGLVILGMVLPFWAVIGGFIGLVTTWVLNPILYNNGVLTTWQPGMKVVDTLYSNTVDFYLSFSIGIALAIFVVSMLPLIKPLMQITFGRKTGPIDAEGGQVTGAGTLKNELFRRNRDRGDISIIVALCIYVCSTILYISICMFLMPGDPVTGQGRFPWMFFLGFAFMYQPVMSYVNAKLEGMVGQHVSIPLVREASFILSGYKGAAIWFAPIPMSDHSQSVREFRVMELTGTKLTSVIKIELLAVPILLVCSFLFCELIWRLAPIPSEAYPFTQEVWDLQARNFALTATSTMDGSSEFLQAVDFGIISWGAVAGVASFMLLSFLNLPSFLVYGAVRGLNQTQPGGLILELVGALVGRFYLQKKLGHQRYKQYVSVLFAGFSAGVGLVGMAAVAIALIVKSTSTLGY